MDTTLLPASKPSDALMEPPIDGITSPLIKPVSSQTENKPTSEFFSETSDDFVDLTNNITEAAAKDTIDISLDEPSDQFVDILGSESPATQEEVMVADVSIEAATDKRDVTSSVTDPPGVGKQEGKVFNPSGDSSASKAQQLAAVDKAAEPLVDFLSDAPPAADAQKPSSALVDLFEDEGSDLFADPRQIKSFKQPQKSLFGEPDEDLFGEPMVVNTKKSTSKEQKDKCVSSNSSAGVSIAGPLEVGNAPEPADIFTEQGTAAVSSARNSSAANSKTNGTCSEEEADIFAGGSPFTRWLHHQQSVFEQKPLEIKIDTDTARVSFVHSDSLFFTRIYLVVDYK